MTALPQRVLLVGATGTIGRATCAALLARGHHVTCLLRPQTLDPGLPLQAHCLHAELSVPAVPVTDALAVQGIEAVVSCMASRSGTAADAWAVDYHAHSALLSAAQTAGVRRFVLLSAICVQKPLLAFQQAKLAFERELAASDLIWSIVRPTAFFKSLSGQVDRLRAGKPFLVFGDGQLTACKPISDRDLSDFIVGCLDNPARQHAILPIGGPGPAITPLEQGHLLFAALGQAPRFRHVPVALIGTIAGVLGALGPIAPKLRSKAELARIGQYYATQSMLLLDPATGRYDAGATPEHGRDRLADHYAQLARDGASAGLGAHAVF